jgi:spermidine synthase
MPDLGELIHCSQDEHGEVHVYQDDRHRYLTFGNQVEQSCMDLADPRRLVHVYTQAMMLACLLHPQADRVLLAGLGGGSLARAMRQARPAAAIVGLEQRAAVIGVAREWFDLPADPGFRIVQAEAGEYLAGEGVGFDLIFADLYRAGGMDPRQTSADFLQSAHERLDANGVLVINRWASEQAGNREASTLIAEVFDGHVLHLTVQGGNILSFAFRGGMPVLRRNELFDQALRLGLRLAIPLQRHARNLWRQNAQGLGVGRFPGRR